MRYLILVLFLFGCGEKAENKINWDMVIEQLEIKNKELQLENDIYSSLHSVLNISTEYIDQSTYWCLPQYFDGVPKYCSYGTYTHKHIPLAFKANGDIYHVYTDNTKDDNFYVYAAKNNEEKVLVHTIENWEDPHTNAIIHVLESGIVHVHVAARGIKERNTFQRGFILASKTPYELDFECIDCDVENIEGYTQAWETKWGEHVNYSKNMYEYDLHETQWMRSPHYRVDDVRKQLIRGGHYYISYYDGETMYIAYNLLVNGHPDNRINLYLIKTTDGTNWTNINNELLELPLEQDSEKTIIYKSTGYVYLKDIEKGKILFTESTDYDPTIGERFVKEFTVDGIRTIAKTSHNYNGAAYIGDNIVLTNNEQYNGWIGGDINLYEDYIKTATDKSSNCSYVRKVINSDDKAVISCDNFHLDNSASHYILTID